MTPATPTIAEAIDLFNRQAFFECHEVLEDLWRPLPAGPEKTFLQGFIQIAVGLHHLQKRNYIGAKNKLAEGLQKLLLIQSTADPIATLPEAFLVEAEHTLTIILSLGKERIHEFPASQFPTIKS